MLEKARVATQNTTSYVLFSPIGLLFDFQQNGTFVEAGANDGVTESNTLALETEYGWTGLLAEPVPWLYNQLLATGRRAAFLDVCISSKQFPFIVRHSRNL
jgi:hypothetical protein